jgi:eukaryotic-like serine/threonine-protein kinase
MPVTGQTPAEARADAATHEFKAARSRYRMVGRISTGRIASVWRATDTVTGNDVAVKRLEPASVADPVARQRLEEEAAVGARVTHPNAVPVIDSVFDRREAAIVFPYLPGETLADRLRGGQRLEPRDAARMALDIADVLTTAHASNVVHRDIKPGNILLAQDGTTRLLDFGISQALDVTADHKSESELTGSGMAIGTLPYMAPEQLTGGRPTAAADVFAIGVVLYEMLAGRRPFAGRSPNEQLALQSEPPEPIDAPQALAAVVMAALDPDPKGRLASGVARRARTKRRANCTRGFRPRSADAAAAHEGRVACRRQRARAWVADRGGSCALGRRGPTRRRSSTDKRGRCCSGADRHSDAGAVSVAQSDRRQLVAAVHPGTSRRR